MFSLVLPKCVPRVHTADGQVQQQTLLDCRCVIIIAVLNWNVTVARVQPLPPLEGGELYTDYVTDLNKNTNISIQGRWQMNILLYPKR